METDSAQEQDAGSSSQASGTDLSEVTRGAWMGSSVSQYEIDWLYRSRRIPEGVTCRIPGDEIEPVLEPGERVVFLAHFERGFGLPVSSFFRDFLDFYKLQPHHLPGNAIFYLSCYVTFMEAYIGIRPTRETFARFFALRINSVQGLDIPKPKPPVQCGSCIIGSRQASPFFKFSGLESCRSWQGTFFYVKNNGAADLIDLPPFDPAPPTKTNWSYNPKESHNETNRIIRFMKQRMKDTNLCSDDIIRTFISRRVLPLKRRAHKMSEMYGPGDPTKITGLPLSKKDVVLKARQICQTSMPEDWEWGLRPLSSTNPPTQEAKDRFPRNESDKRGRCRKRGLDKFDPDPVIFWKDLKMGRTPAARLGKAPPEPSDVPSANLNPQVHEHVAPLQAEAGKEFVDKLMAQGQKNKTPASDAGSSQAPPAKRFRTEPVAGKVVAMRRRKGKQMPTATGPALKLGPRPEGSAGSARTSTPPPHSSPAPSGAGNTSASPLGGTTSSGRAAPTPPDPRAEEDFASPPETQDTGASNMGAGKEPAGRAEPSVPPVLEKKKRKKTSSKTAPEASAPETSAPPPPPETSAPEATGPTPTPPPTQGAPATAPKPPPASLKITDYLKPGASRGKATDGSASSGSQPLVLHTGPAAMAVQDKPSGLLGRIVELKRGGQDLGPLLPYAQRWNAADISAATRGLGKDRLPAPDPAGPRSTEEHFTRLKRAVKEFDSAWYDATANVVSTADARKALFEELLWEHRSLAEAHSKCLAIPEASIEALKDQVAKLQAEKEQLIRDHQEALDAQKEISRELKDQAMQAGVRYAEELKAAEAAAEARLNEALEDAGNANVVLQAELEEGAKALKAAEGKAAKAHKAAAEEARKAQKAAESEVARLKAEQKEYDLLVTRTDALALRLFPDSQAHAIKKVAEHRAKQAGDNLGAPWDPYDHLVALSARISHMRSVDRNLSDIPEVASQLFKTLWPGEAVPDTFSLISDRLKGACRRIREWQCSAARAGADSALRIACSWYPELDLDAFIGVREGAPTDVDPALTAKRQDRAYHIAEYADMRTFIPPPEDVKDYLSEEEEDEGEDVPPPTPDAGAAPPEAPAA
ncbi:hypothetical protein QYE76_023327 [Lolium multiflorum]|uniref:Transposase (putative) gypsy type domain-containing protein n=1 Tax=Lolium multiflorum TaxID=4521 RepID=A0AAD8VUM3_LOLMU|nr:hypothetical protein QYE76_023327 [Lolium multiflorum]